MGIKRLAVAAIAGLALMVAGPMATVVAAKKPITVGVGPDPLLAKAEAEAEEELEPYVLFELKGAVPNKQYRIVVEDAPDVRRALTELLASEGYAVAATSDGGEALQTLRGGLRPAVILLDLMMPNCDGWDFRREQLEDPAFAAVPIPSHGSRSWARASPRRTSRTSLRLAKTRTKTAGRMSATARCHGQSSSRR